MIRQRRARRRPFALGAFAGLKQNGTGPGDRSLIQALGRGFNFALFIRRSGIFMFSLCRSFAAFGGRPRFMPTYFTPHKFEFKPNRELTFDFRAMINPARANAHRARRAAGGSGKGSRAARSGAPHPNPGRAGLRSGLAARSAFGTSARFEQHGPGPGAGFNIQPLGSRFDLPLFIRR